MLKKIKYDKHVYQILFDGDIVGCIFQMSNDKWALFDKEDKRIMKGVLTNTPTQAFNKFKEVFNTKAL